jgi:hypothetical protein
MHDATAIGGWVQEFCDISMRDVIYGPPIKLLGSKFIFLKFCLS